MKRLISIFFYISMFFCLSGSAELLDPLEILYFSETNNLEALCYSFDKNHNISVQDAREFLLRTFEIIQSHYLLDISFNELKSKIIEILENVAVDQSSLDKVKPILTLTINELFPHKKISTIVLIKSPLKQPTSEIEIPSCVIVGTTEIVCAVLLWLTPFRTLSIPLMADGLRRMGNAVEEKDKELREYPERQYHPHKYR